MPTPATCVEELLATADRLLAGHLEATPAGCRRGACLALRTALEITVDRILDATVPGLSGATTRAKILCLRCYITAQAARRIGAVWSHLCLGCHYHQYEMGPTHDQVRTWRTEVGEIVRALTA